MTFELNASLRERYPHLEDFTNQYLNDLTVYRTSAIRFLTTLAQIDESEIDSYPFCFQIAKQPEASALPSEISWALPRNRTGSFIFCEKWLRETNLPQHGGFMGAYVTVNETDGQGRKKEHITNVRSLFVELDHGGLNDTHISEFIDQFVPSIVVESSPGKLHCYWLLQAGICPLESFGFYQSQLQAKFVNLRAGPETKDLPRVLRIPGFLHLKNLNHPFVVTLHHCDSSLIYTSVEEVFAACKIDQTSSTTPEKTQSYVEASSWSPEVLTSIDAKTGKYLGAPKNHRNTALFRWMREYLCQYSENEPVAIFHKACLAANKKNKPPLDETEVLASAESALMWFNTKMLEREALARNSLSEFGSVLEQDIIPNSFLPVISYDYNTSGMACAISDESLAERVVQICGAKINHSNVGGFYVYNDLIWANANGEGKQLVSKFMRDLFRAVPGEREVQECFTTPPENELNYKLLASFRRYVHSAICRRASMDLLSQRIEIATTPDQFNREEEADVIACPNGILDLPSGRIVDSDPAYRLTHVMGTPFDADAKCPTWDYFVSSCMGGDPVLIEYIQKITGYFLSGRTHLQCIFVAYGRPGTGKSVYLNVLHKLLAGYCRELMKNVLIVGGSENARMSSLAQAIHCRLATIQEVKANEAWDESLVKALSGNDSIVAKLSHKDTLEFTPRFKVCVRANDLPTSDQLDEALWDRLKFIPFEVRFRGTSQQDPFITEKLVNELPGVLNWAVEGYQKLLLNGLAEPVQAKTQRVDSQHEAEPIRVFLEECCEKVELKDGLKSVEFYAAYENFCRSRGVDIHGKKRVRKLLLGEYNYVEGMVRVDDSDYPVRYININLKQEYKKQYSIKSNIINIRKDV